MKLVIIITGLNTGGAQMMLLKVLERLGQRFSPHVISLTSIGEIVPAHSESWNPCRITRHAGGNTESSSNFQADTFSEETKT